jgi:hypothetical protein
MSLAVEQATIARILVDGPWRRSFFADPQIVGRAAGLDDGTITQLVAQRGRFEKSARALVSKRRRAVGRLLSHFLSFFGSRFRNHFDAYADSHPPAADPLAEAVAFLADLRAAPPHPIPVWLINHEEDHLLIRTGRRRFAIRRLQQPNRRLLSILWRGQGDQVRTFSLPWF